MEVNKIKNSLSKNNLRDSYNRASSYFVKTPIIKANFLSAYLDTNIYLKLEDQQKTSAFKFRGAINALLPLKSSGNEKTVVCYSICCIFFNNFCFSLFIIDRKKSI